MNKIKKKERIKLPSQKQHHQFRRNVAAMATRQNDQTRTLKFPLQEPDSGWPLTFEASAQLYNTVEGVGRGTLAGWVFVLMISRFRAFSSAGNTQLHRDQSLLPDANYREVFQKHFAQEPRNFIPAQLIDYFKKEKRSRGRKVLAADDLAGELYRLGTGKLPEKEKTLCQPLLEACTKIAKQIANKISHWHLLREQFPLCLEIIDRVLSSLNKDFPKIAPCLKKLRDLQPVSTSIDYSYDALCAESLDEELLPYQAVAAQCSHLHKAGQAIDSKAVQALITTTSFNALSWLFGTGLIYWQTTDLNQICQDYGIPTSDQERVKTLQEWARAIPHDPLFDEQTYAKYRSAVGGKIDSWIANYLKRLLLLESTLSEMVFDDISLPEALQQPENAHYFSGQTLTPQEWPEIVSRLREAHTKVQQALNRLLGRADQLPNRDDLATFEHFSALVDALHGEITSLNNRIEQESERTTDKTRKEAIKALLFKPPKWLEELPKVPSLSGGVVDYDEELKACQEKLAKLSTSYFEQVAEVAGSPTFSQILESVEDNEKQRLEKHPKASEQNYPLLARRRLLDMYVQAIKKTPEAFKQHCVTQLAESGLFALDESRVQQAKDLPAFRAKRYKKPVNDLIINGKGRVYVSLYSTGRHAPVLLDETTLTNLDLLAWIEADLQWLTESSELSPKDRYQQKLEWRILRARLQQLAMPARVETNLLKKDLSELRVPSLLKTLLDGETIAANKASRILNLYTSEIRGCLTQLFRSTFFLRTRITRIGDNELVYVPNLKEDRWQWHNLTRIRDVGKTLFSQWLTEQYPDGSTLDLAGVRELYDSHKSLWNRSADNPLSNLLRQLPHDWYLPLGFAPEYNIGNTTGFTFNKKVQGKPKAFSQAVRLIGSQDFKAMLDQQLTDPTLTHGDYTLLIEQHYEQSVEITGYTLTVHSQPQKLKLDVALPIKEEAPSKKDFSLDQTYIGIDLGEAGIGYAIIDARTHEILDSGSYAIRAVRNLIRRVKGYRKNKQPKQKFSQRFDTSLLELRENAVADTCTVINTLMARYNGVPILESSVRNLPKGAKQLELVYDKILNLYTFSDLDAHKSARKHFWCGSENWEHAFARETVTKDGKETVRALKLFPGTQVHPAGTSQTCSKCRRNPYELIRDAYKTQKSYVSNDQGELKIEGATLLLKTNSLSGREKKTLSPEELRDYEKKQKQYRTQKRRHPFIYRVINQRFSFDDLKRQLRKQLRRAPRDKRSKDTTQSEYHCCFKDCGHHMHADENAAINIVRKWLHDKNITR